MRRPFVCGNWKMNHGPAETRRYLEAFLEPMRVFSAIDVAIAPPFVSLAAAQSSMKGSALKLCAQNVHGEVSGAFTGEVAAPMLVEAGCQYVIVGHSERRQYFQETDAMVAEKAVVALKHGLLPIVCVGETLDQRDRDQTKDVVGRQIDAVLAKIPPEKASELVFAYEPVWAIGTGRSANAVQAQEVHSFIRQRLRAWAPSQGGAETVRILYGGSVKADNAHELMKGEDVDGALVGGASLQVQSFSDICRATLGSLDR